MPDLRPAIAAIREAIEKISFPGWKWDVAPPWHDDAGSHARSAEGLLEVLDVQHPKVLKSLMELGDEVGPR